MKFTIDNTIFASALQHVSRAIPNRTTLPVLSGVLLSARDSKLKLVATDLELAIETHIPANVAQEGDIVLPARYLSELVRRIPGGLLDFEKTENGSSVSIRWGRSEYIINGHPVDQFPSLPQLDKTAEITLPWQELTTVLGGSLFAASQEEIRAVLTGLYVTIGDNRLQALSTDGFRIAYRQTSVPASQDQISMIIPGKNVSELLRLPAEQNIKVKAGENQVFFDLGEIKFVSRLLDGTYPPVLELIPREYRVRIKAGRQALQDVCERASLCTDPREKAQSLNLKWNEETLYVTASSPTLGVIREELPIHAEGEKFEIIFNARYLIEGLKSARAEEVVLELSGPLTAARLTAPGDDGFLYIIMPMKPNEGSI